VVVFSLPLELLLTLVYSIFNSNFTKNSVITRGGGVYVDIERQNSAGSIENCTFDSNTGSDGGGIYVFYTYTNLRIRDCTFTRNNVLGNGGGLNLFSTYKNDITLQQCIFQYNIADTGAGMYIGLDTNSALHGWYSNVVTENIATSPNM